MPFMTVAENIWIRREPKNRFGFVDHGEMRRKTEELFKRAQHRDRSRDRGRATSRVANRQMVEIAKAVSYEFRRPDHGRADLGADRDARSSICSRSSATLQGAGQRHRLHHPQDERAVRDRRRVLGVPRRPVCRHARRQGCDPRRHHPHDGRPRDHPDVPEGGGADRRGRAVGREPHPRRRVPRRLVRAARGRDPRRRRPGRLGPQQRRRDDLRRDAGDLGHDRDRRQDGARSTRPATAMRARHGVPDRGPQGDRLLPDPRRAREHADRGAAATATSRAASSTQARLDARLRAR